MAEKHPRAPLLLTLAGALPFVGLAVAMLAFRSDEPAWYAWASLGLLFYAGVILSFLGGIRWGAALAIPRRAGVTFVLSVMPALIGWALMLVGAFGPWPPIAYIGFAAAFVFQYLWDLFGMEAGALPKWFRLERTLATALAVTSLLFAALIAR